jgi:glycosyltransferase involved in cell wall biosynthesis
VGGTERECSKIAGKLKSLGHEVSILTQSREDLPAHEVIDGLHVYRYIKGWHLFEFTYMLSVLSFLVRQRHNIDFILCFGLYLFTAPAVLFGRLLGKKVFCRLESARETGDFVRISKLKLGRFILRCAKRAHGAIAITKEIEAELLNNGFPSYKVIRIPNSVDTKEFGPGLQKESEPFVICYVGRLAQGKGLQTLIKALIALREHTEKFEVFIVGDGELKKSLIEQVESCGLKKHVTFTGAVDNVVPYYQRSHVFVLPSHSEGMPLALLEAMACGATVVASKVGGIRDVLGPPEQEAPGPGGYWICRQGILVLPADDKALSEALCMLATHRPLLQALAQKALETVADFYSLETVVQQYIPLLSQSGRKPLSS